MVWNFSYLWSRCHKVFVFGLFLRCVTISHYTVKPSMESWSKGTSCKILVFVIPFVTAYMWSFTSCFMLLCGLSLLVIAFPQSLYAMLLSQNAIHCQVHNSICRELTKILDRIIAVLPAIESARPGYTAGIQELCSLNNTIEKAKLLIQHCAESSKLYLVSNNFIFLEFVYFLRTEFYISFITSTSLRFVYYLKLWVYACNYVCIFMCAGGRVYMVIVVVVLFIYVPYPH